MILGRWLKSKRGKSEKKPGYSGIRRYRARDLPELRRIAVESFDGVCSEQNVEEAFGKLGGSDWRDRLSLCIERDIQWWPEGVFVAEHDGRVVGFVSTATDRATRTGHIRNLAVAEEYRSRGIGRALIEEAQNYFRNNGMKFARIETLEQNERCVGLYPALGFTEVGRQVLFFKEL